MNDFQFKVEKTFLVFCFFKLFENSFLSLTFDDLKLILEND
jgi:hypothetical protein